MGSPDDPSETTRSAGAFKRSYDDLFTQFYHINIIDMRRQNRPSLFGGLRGSVVTNKKAGTET